MKKISLDVILRATGIFAKLIALVVLENILSIEEFSNYIFLLSIIALGSNLARFGTDNLLFRTSTALDLKRLLIEISKLITFYANSLILKILIFLISLTFMSIYELLVVFISIECLNFLHYYSLVIRGRGRITESIFIYEVLPPLIFLLGLFILNTNTGVDTVFIQYFAHLLIFIFFILREFRLIKTLYKVHHKFVKITFFEIIKKIYPFGSVNITNAFMSWGDILIITLLFDPLVSSAYFLVNRVFSAVERFSVLPLYPAYNTLGKNFERQGAIPFTIFKITYISIAQYLLILIIGCIAMLSFINVTSLPIFEILNKFSPMWQLMICFSLLIFSLGTVIESIAFVIGFEKNALINAIFISIFKLFLSFIIFLMQDIELYLYLSFSVIIVFVLKSILMSQIVKAIK